MSILHDAGKGLLLTYATPMYAQVLSRTAKTNAGLRARILHEERRFSGLEKSNVGGWHSKPDLFAWDEPTVGVLLGWIGKSVKQMTDYGNQGIASRSTIDTVGWANVCRTGDYHRTHMHPGHDWSGVYYVDAGAASASYPNSGIIEFLDPRAGVNLLDTPGKPYSGVVHFRPESGMLLLFPSWLGHFVNPYHGVGERISIAFNVRMVASAA
ncbi:MAG: hypothetical protein K0U93_07615 [Gammaproteobacteria bacterium]|nr:hypothetical protein [Gammaproteobacteria bacterium]